jgi:hypothetical protein
MTISKESVIADGNEYIENSHYWFRDKIDIFKEEYKSLFSKEKWDWKFKCREDFWQEIKPKVELIEKEISEIKNNQFITPSVEKLRSLTFQIEQWRWKNTLMY